MADDDVLITLLLGGALGFVILFAVIYGAVLAAIRESRKPPKVKKE